MARILSDAELVALHREFSGIDAHRLAQYTEPLLVADPEDAGEIRVIEWTYDDRVRFLLEAARFARRPH